MESAPGARVLQQQTLEAHTGRVTWHDSLDAAGDPPFVGGVLSNELLDALPFHRVVCQDGALRELWVTEEAGRLVETAGELSRPKLCDYFHPYGFLPPHDAPVEVCLAAPEWIASAARCLRRGFILTIDYGDLAEALYQGDGAGTMHTCTHHAMEAIPSSVWASRT